MADYCKNCGAELIAGHQFCRSCGARTALLDNESFPTQILPNQQTANPTLTSPLHGRETDQVYPSAYSSYQPPAAQQSAGLPVVPRRRSRVWRVLLVALLLVAVTAIGGSLFLAHYINSTLRQVKMMKIDHPPMSAIPPVPPVAIPQGDEETLDEDGADVSDNQTVITKTFALKNNGTFTINNFKGQITLEGWDKPEAEVKITKHGGDADERGDQEIMYKEGNNQLSFRTPPESQSVLKDVQYEVKLPRALRQIEINSLNSDVKLSDLNAVVAINVQQGNIELLNINGHITAQSTSGNLKATLTNSASNEPQLFNTISGNIELQLQPDLNATLTARTISGQIKVDDSFGLKPENQIPGQQLTGRFGNGGGKSVTVKTVSGNIKIKKP